MPVRRFFFSLFAAFQGAFLFGSLPLGSEKLWATAPFQTAEELRGSGEGNQRDFFESKIRPVLAEHCYRCHSKNAKVPRGGLLLDHRESLLRGGESGPPFQPGSSTGSLLLAALRHESLQMPPEMRLDEAVIRDFAIWIDSGAFDPREETSPTSHQTDSQASLNSPRSLQHWAFQPIRLPSLPSVQFPAWAQTPVDLFVLDRLEKQGWSPASTVDKSTLLRRATFDLIGLPPSSEEIQDFLQDESPDSFERVVDRLLASPSYGERWGRHWLDLVRYADSNGADENHDFPNAWRYRDWVVRSLNRDLPWNEFIVQQLAGDLLVSSQQDEFEIQDLLAATGMLVVGPKMLAEQDKPKMRIDIIDEQIDTVSRTMLGLTIACARCHDHKFDPISANDYYAMAGIFGSTRTMADEAFVSKWMERTLPSIEVDRKRMEYQPKIDAAQNSLDRTIEQAKSELLATGKFPNLPEQPEKHFSDESRKRIEVAQKELDEVRKRQPPLLMAMSVEEGTVADLPVHARGNHLKPASTATPRGVPARLASVARFEPIEANQSGRLQLARWLTSPDQPLTARVMVNRVWMWHFGKPLVRNPSNFGLQAEPPSHPELLDWLARRWIEEGWSLKKLHRWIMLSHAYQMTSQSTDHSDQDPENLSLWRQNRRRLEVEPLRDAILASADSLNHRMFGPSSPDNEQRRTLYMRIDRAALNDLLSTFDYVETASHLEQRPTTTVPYQALFLLNHPMIFSQSGAIAQQVIREVPDDSERIRWLWLRLLARSPSVSEVERTQAYLQATMEQFPVAASAEERQLKSWASLIRCVLAGNEFIYVE